MLKKFLTILFFALFFAPLYAPLYAQTAAELEELLKIQKVSYGQAASFVLEAADAAVLKDAQQACDFAAERSWLPKKAAAQDAARLDGVSLLIMRSFGIKGGLWYSITKNPHFAYRELVYKDVIQGEADPGMTVSGERLLFMINRLLAIQEAAPESGENTEQLTEEQERQMVLVEEINTQLEALAVADTTARVTNEGVTISLSNIQFLANSAELPESEKKKLREIAQILKTIPQRKILITGHTALAGTEQDRMKTSLERAQATANYLVSIGARKADEIEVRGFGSLRPIADNKTQAGMALNRRVEITIVGDKP